MLQTCIQAVLAARRVWGERAGSAQPGSGTPRAADAIVAASMWGKLCWFVNFIKKSEMSMHAALFTVFSVL